MRLLILTQDYPSQSNPYALAYIHTRVREYKKKGFSVNVLSFNCKNNYEFEEISVSGKLTKSNFDILISHAPNLRSHAIFILLNFRKFKKIMFWFHGHEIMNVAKDYPAPYKWKKTNKRKLHRLYTPIKFLTLKYGLKFIAEKKQTHFIFVSNWMKNIFEKNIFRISNYNWKIIHNPIHPVFQEKSYQPNYNSKGVCIRPWDNSKYAVDLVLNFARVNKHLSIDVFGGGDFPKHYKIPDNLNFKEQFFLQKDIPKLLDQYNFAIMPTRLDAQGVMACEIASYGIPLITNSIDIMNEMIGSFINVYFISEPEFNRVISLKELKPIKMNKNKFDFNSIISEELKLFQ